VHSRRTAAFVRNPDANLQADSPLAKMAFAVGDDAKLLSTTMRKPSRRR
jgi:indolepyruvate ferredoxin oxidoreductase